MSFHQSFSNGKFTIHSSNVGQIGNGNTMYTNNGTVYGFGNGATVMSSQSSEDFNVKGSDVEVDIDGVKYQGKNNIVVKNGDVFVDGVSQGAHATLPVSRSYNVQITGKQIDSVNTAGSATVNGNCTKLSTGGSATVTGNVEHLSAGGSANVTGNAGSVSAGGSVNVGSTSGRRW